MTLCVHNSAWQLILLVFALSIGILYDALREETWESILLEHHALLDFVLSIIHGVCRIISPWSMSAYMYIENDQLIDYGMLR